MSFEVKLTPELGQALISWEERMTAVWQTVNHARLMIEPLNDMHMTNCARMSGEIYKDIEDQLGDGRLVARMKLKHAVDYPVIRTKVGQEVFRQFHNCLFPYLFSGVDDEQEQELLKAVDEFLVSARAAVEPQEMVVPSE